MNKKTKPPSGATMEFAGAATEKFASGGAEMTIIDAEKESDVSDKAPKMAAGVAKEASAGDRMLAVIEKASTDTRCNVEKMRALLDMKMELVKDERRMAYNRAMRSAQEEMKPIVRTAWNESTRSAFAKLEHVDNLIRPIYTKHGFSLSFDSRRQEDKSITMFVDVMHDDGHEKRHELNAPIDDKGPKGTPNKTGPQGVASSASILQRKLTVMVFNLTFINDDDDGQGGIVKPKADRFTAASVAKKTGATTPPAKEGDPKPTLKTWQKTQPMLDEAAQVLIDRINAAPTKADKGTVLMANIKLLGKLEEEGYGETVAEIRQLAETEVANG